MDLRPRRAQRAVEQVGCELRLEAYVGGWRADIEGGLPRLTMPQS